MADGSFADDPTATVDWKEKNCGCPACDSKNNSSKAGYFLVRDETEWLGESSSGYKSSQEKEASGRQRLKYTEEQLVSM